MDLLEKGHGGGEGILINECLNSCAGFSVLKISLISCLMCVCAHARVCARACAYMCALFGSLIIYHPKSFQTVYV